MNTKSNDCNVAQECAGTEGEMVMTDRELLELAAKAAGIAGTWCERGQCILIAEVGMSWEHWRPLDDDGDALRLAVKLHIDVAHDDICGKRFVYVRSFVAGRDPVGLSEIFDDEHYRQAATRRAIVRAAAEIGK